MNNDRYITADLIKKLIHELKLYDDIDISEMPEYRLYISQMEEFLDKKLAKGTGEGEEKKIISKTMIQNYIKDGILMPPDGKSYNRNHVVLLILIYQLKSILVIKDIKKFLSPILLEVDNEENSEKIEHIYASYIGLKDKVLDQYVGLLTNNINMIEEYVDKDRSYEQLDKSSLILLVLTLINQANVCKKMAECIIDEYFTNEETN